MRRQRQMTRVVRRTPQILCELVTIARLSFTDARDGPLHPTDCLSPIHPVSSACHARRRLARGFTLIELMVVLVIIWRAGRADRARARNAPTTPAPRQRAPM